MTDHPSTRVSVAEDTLVSIGMDARNDNAILGSLDLSGKNVRGGCIDITKDILTVLNDEHGIPDDALVQYRCNVGPTMELHYAAAIASQFIEGHEDTDGFVVVDASIDQYCDEQAAIGRVDTSFGAYEDLPRVAVLPVGDGRRQQWYHNPTGEHDPSSEFKPQRLTQ